MWSTFRDYGSDCQLGVCRRFSWRFRLWPRSPGTSSKWDLSRKGTSGRLSRELDFQANGACLCLPPLRQRRDDIPILMECFLTKRFAVVKRTIPSLNRRALDFLPPHWPGNIRERENLAPKTVAFGDVQTALRNLRSTKSVNGIPEKTKHPKSMKPVSGVISRQGETAIIKRTLKRTRWSRTSEAQELRIGDKGPLYKIKQIGSSKVDHEG